MITVSIGSAQNIHLARLSRGKKILFLEGDDYRLLKRFAARLNLFDFTNNINITVIPIGGFSQRQRIEDAAWTFQKVLKAEIAIAALLDRDYRCVEEIESLVTAARSTVPNFHILSGKEIENYLLIPSAISRAVMDRFKEGKRSGGEAAAPISASDIEQILLNIANEIKSNVLSQYISNRIRFFGQRSSKDPATVAREAIAILDSNWSGASRRFMVIPGKQTLALLNSKLQSALGVSITTSQIVKNITPSEIAPDLHKILHDLNEFAGKS